MRKPKRHGPGRPRGAVPGRKIGLWIHEPVAEKLNRLCEAAGTRAGPVVERLVSEAPEPGETKP